MDQKRKAQDLKTIINADIQESMEESLTKSFQQLKEGKYKPAKEYMNEIGKRYGIKF